MYIPDSFREDDPRATAAVINAFPFATVVSHTVPPDIAHVPVIAVETEVGVFEGHFARANPIANVVLEGGVLTACFLGPHDYVSPTWYATPRMVPTWNFAAVHVTGAVSAVTGRDALAGLVERLAERFEHGRDEPWIPDYANAMLDAIVGFRLRAEKIESKFKFSQNRSRADRDGVIAALQEGGQGARELARWMREPAGEVE